MGACYDLHKGMAVCDGLREHGWKQSDTPTAVEVEWAIPPAGYERPHLSTGEW